METDWSYTTPYSNLNELTPPIIFPEPICPFILKSGSFPAQLPGEGDNTITNQYNIKIHQYSLLQKVSQYLHLFTYTSIFHH